MQERMSSFASHIKIYGGSGHLVQNHENWKVFLYTNIMPNIINTVTFLQLHTCIHHVSVSVTFLVVVSVQTLIFSILKCWSSL